MTQPFKLQTENWLQVGAREVEAIDGGKDKIREAAAALEWINVTAQNSQMRLPFSQGFAIKEAIRQFELKPRAIAYHSNVLLRDNDGEGVAIYGIHAQHANGVSTLYMLDKGDAVTPVLSVFEPSISLT